MLDRDPRLTGPDLPQLFGCRDSRICQDWAGFLRLHVNSAVMLASEDREVGSGFDCERLRAKVCYFNGLPHALKWPAVRLPDDTHGQNQSQSE
jgi:hypothetical protein